MQVRTRELLLAFITIFLITLLYTGVVYRLGEIPTARSFFGHSLGVLGFILMALTESLYSLRKRSHQARWGKMENWLKLHIYTGLVGPYLVLLHTAWSFNGLAGLALLLTLLIVISGFVGRYIYTVVPRTADGVVLEAVVINQHIHAIEEEIARWQSAQATLPVKAVRRKLAQNPAYESTSPAFTLMLGRWLSDWSFWSDRRREQRRLRAPVKTSITRVNQLLQQRRVLSRQLASLTMARRILALWYIVHIPLGVAMFITIFVHIFAALYYATLLH